MLNAPICRDILVEYVQGVSHSRSAKLLKTLASSNIDLVASRWRKLPQRILRLVAQSADEIELIYA